MSFLLYGTKDEITWVQRRPFPFAELLRRYVLALMEEEAKEGSWVKKPPLSWSSSEEDLLRIEGRRRPSRYGPPGDSSQLALPALTVGYRKWFFVFDIKPDLEGNVSLYRLDHVWGYSQQTWTPICLRLDPLFVDLEVEDSEEFKHKFQVPPPEERGGPVHEFLYVNHPHGVKGRWEWGKVGHVNGALLWPEALAYFIERIAVHGRVPLDYELIFDITGVPPKLRSKLQRTRRSRARGRALTPGRRSQ